jgi:dipeptidyl aminopeptidase/acylaminoacyl peptidase
MPTQADGDDAGVCEQNLSPKCIAVADLFRNPVITTAKISPDGRHLATLGARGPEIDLKVVERGSNEQRSIAALAGSSITNVDWKGSDFLVYQKDLENTGRLHVFVTDLRNGKETDLTPYPGIRTRLYNADAESASTVLIEMNYRNRKVMDPYLLDVETGQLAMLAENPGDITEWVPDQKGVIRTAVRSAGPLLTLLYRATEASPWSEVLTCRSPDYFLPLWYSTDNRSVLAYSNLGRPTLGIVEVDPATGKEKRVLFEHPEYDVLQMNFLQIAHAPGFVTYSGWKDEHHFFSTPLARAFGKIYERFPDAHCELLNQDRSSSTFVFSVQTPMVQPAIYLLELRTERITKIVDTQPWLKPSAFSEVKPIDYVARDGTKIFGYLTLPKHRPATGLPLIVMTHSGYFDRFRWRFYPEVQLFASRGYAVLQINPRGSDGYGTTFLRAGFGQWGERIQDDVTDGVEWLIGSGVVDPTKVGIFGRSLGGYTAIMGAIKTPSLFRAVASLNGVLNLVEYTEELPEDLILYRGLLQELCGNPETERERLLNDSPVTHSSKFSIPVFIGQGAKHPQVPVSKTRDFVNALRQAGTPVDYFEAENEGESLTDEGNRIAFYQALLTFFLKNVPPAS